MFVVPSEKLDKDNLDAFFMNHSSISVFLFILKGTGGSVDTGWDPDLASEVRSHLRAAKQSPGSWPVEQLRTKGKVLHSDWPEALCRTQQMK